MDLFRLNLHKNTLKYSTAKTVEKIKHHKMQGSFSKMPVYFDNNVLSHIRKVRSFSSPHCQFSFLNKKTEVPPTVNTDLSPLSHTTVLVRTLPPTKKACLVTEGPYLVHITTVFFFTEHISK